MNLEPEDLDSALNNEYLSCVDKLDGDEEGRRRAWEAMAAGSAYYHGEPVAFDFLPRICSPRTRRRFAAITETVYGILIKVMRAYLDDPAFRREFRFDPRVEKLISLPRGTDELLPMARFDMLYDYETGRFAFCEFNTDSSSGMNETREALHALRQTPSFAAFADRHNLEDDMDLQFAGWVRTFKSLWETRRNPGLSPHAPAATRSPDSTEMAQIPVLGESLPRCESAAAQSCLNISPMASESLPRSKPIAAAGKRHEAASEQGPRPRVAIVACLDDPNPEIGELETFVPLFEEAGFSCSVFDVRGLFFDGQRLWGKRALAGEGNVPIDCIWRFCIVVDLLEHWDEVQDLIEALRREKVLMIGSFATQIAHDKQLFAVLRTPAAQRLLTEEERAFVDEHIPFTAFLDDPSLDLGAVRRNPDRWVLKPTDWYASKNVIAGAECGLEQWNARLDACLAKEDGSPYLIQEFKAPYKAPAIPLYGRPEDFTAGPRAFGNLIGLFCHGGHFGGTYLRQGPHHVIGSAREGLVAPVLWALD